MRVQDVWLSRTIDRSDAEVLLCTLLRCDRSWILAHAEDVLPEDRRAKLRSWMIRRERGEPVAYITGEKEFYGRTLSVDPSVLIPRPATEGLIDGACELLRTHSPARILREIDAGIVVYGERWAASAVACIADIGTGSGCIAVTMACEDPHLSVIATDVSPSALSVARRNAEAHGVSGRIELRYGPLLTPLEGVVQPFLVVSNPPYVPSAFPLTGDTLFEPPAALIAGREGTDVLIPLVRAARKHPACRGVVVECRSDQVRVLQ